MRVKIICYSGTYKFPNNRDCCKTSRSVGQHNLPWQWTAARCLQLGDRELATCGGAGRHRLAGWSSRTRSMPCVNRRPYNHTRPLMASSSALPVCDAHMHTQNVKCTHIVTALLPPCSTCSHNKCAACFCTQKALFIAEQMHSTVGDMPVSVCVHIRNYILVICML